MPSVRLIGLPEALVALAAGLSLVAGTVTAAGWPAPQPGAGAGRALPARVAQPAAELPAGSAVDGLPLRLSIPALGLHRDLVALQRRADGGLEVPADHDAVGRWSGAGPDDPVVLAGHVDSVRGPAVFFRLGELRPGDVVLTGTRSGLVRHVVDRVERHAKDRFPTFEVFGGDGPGQLRLVTCGGAFDRTTRSYTDNVVVYASARRR